MTDEKLYNYGQSPLSPYQQARAEALKTGASVLSASQALWNVKKPPVEITGVDDLLKVADWILGNDRPEIPMPPSRSQVEEALRRAGFAPVGGVFEIKPEDLPSVFQTLGEVTEDCGHPNCPIHAPTREARDLDPDDARSSFDNADGEGRMEPPIDFMNMEQTGMAEASDFEGGETDAANEREDRKYPPRVTANLYHVGTVMNDRAGDSWKVVRRPDGGVKWERVLADHEDDDVADDEEMPEF